MNKVVGIFAAATALFIGAGSVASAAFSSRHAGSECVPYLSNETNYAYSNGRIGNTSTTDTLRVICPVPRLGSSTFTASITVADNHSAQDFDCTLMAVNSTTGITQTANRRVQSSGDINNSGNTIHSFSPALPNYTHAHLECDIPPVEGGTRSYLADYTINES